ncbi:energy transducer TonB [Chitinophaga sp. sic0106]|uniref:energy transducer TonB n=1 Tax=Chitinophaga sp. sic0106 TaxID=2854785 RepID=UPI001C48038B|nr:energy transducer TonB [Chitinophaga sp. sic0106]MBV7528729.1 energy transducer TonB [Chitinophaga sp. sic0106]
MRNLKLPLLASMAISLQLHYNGLSAQNKANSQVLLRNEKDISRFLNKNIRYPRRAHELHLSGMLTIYYDIQTDGSVTNINTIANLKAASFSREVERVVSLMKFENGKEEKKCVDMIFISLKEDNSNYPTISKTADISYCIAYPTIICGFGARRHLLPNLVNYIP